MSRAECTGVVPSAHSLAEAIHRGAATSSASSSTVRRHNRRSLRHSSHRAVSVSTAAYREEYVEQSRRGPYEPQYGQQYGPQYGPQYAPDRPSPAQREQRQSLAPVPRQRPRPVRRIKPPPPDEPTLSCQSVVNKEVITRTSGRSLGVVSELFADPETLTIVSANLRAKGLSLAASSAGNLLLETFCQIGDVVLVHDESALDFVPQDSSLGFINPIGYPMLTSAGVSLGRVREFTFSPETGRLDLLKYDALGWPSVPEKLIGSWQVGVECVDVVTDQGIFLLPGAETEILRVSDGPLEAAFLALQNLFQDAGSDDLADGTTDYEYEKWKQTYGAMFTRAYGQPPPATRREMDTFNQGMEAAKGPRAPPRALPPPSSAAMADVLQPSQRERVPVNRAAYPPREDPRRRRAAADPRRQPAQQQPPPPRRPAGNARVASVPIIERTPPPPYQRRDADGRLGEPQAYQPAQPSGPLIEEWMDESSAQREPLLQSYGAMPPPQTGSPEGPASQQEASRWGPPGPSSWPEQQTAAPQWASRGSAPRPAAAADERSPSMPPQANAGGPASDWRQGNGSAAAASSPREPGAVLGGMEGMSQPGSQPEAPRQGPPAGSVSQGKPPIKQAPVWPGDGGGKPAAARQGPGVDDQA